MFWTIVIQITFVLFARATCTISSITIWFAIKRSCLLQTMSTKEMPFEIISMCIPINDGYLVNNSLTSRYLKSRYDLLFYPLQFEISQNPIFPYLSYCTRLVIDRVDDFDYSQFHNVKCIEIPDILNDVELMKLWNIIIKDMSHVDSLNLTNLYIKESELMKPMATLKKLNKLFLNQSIENWDIFNDITSLNTLNIELDQSKMNVMQIKEPLKHITTLELINANQQHLDLLAQSCPNCTHLSNNLFININPDEVILKCIQKSDLSPFSI
eukprot:NODE_243_length_11887_cov_0.520699.p4 type:complete len:269 gc:universal NODE_243_length_11887_cov_0.520699:1087-1893(+)